MKISELNIRKTESADIDVSWRLSDGDQSSYDLFLIEGGSIVERVRMSTGAMKCTLHTITEPMKEYALLLTVRSGMLLSSVLTGFCTQKDSSLYQSVTYS